MNERMTTNWDDREVARQEIGDLMDAGEALTRPQVEYIDSLPIRRGELTPTQIKAVHYLWLAVVGGPEE